MTKKFCMTMLPTSFLIALLFAAGCESKQDREFNEKMKQLEELQKKRESRINQLRTMTVDQLARELAAESEQSVEPFNSMTVMEIASRGEQVATQLRALLKQADRRSFLGLMALRRASTAQYQLLESAFRANVLIDALANSKYFNTWGLPHLYWEDAAKAIVAEGQVAERPLLALLQNKKEAPMWGSDEVIEYEKYRYRVCDYAWALLNDIRGSKREIPTAPGERDRLIAEVPQ